jgi:putative ABC transport system ATP-binding protein
MSAEADWVIQTHDLCRSYPMGDTKVDALRSVNLSVRRGEFLALMGPSGSGKSTLMHILGCLDRPSSGQYLLEGQDVSRMNDDQRAGLRSRRLGFIFQSFNLLPRLDALENVALPMFYLGDDRDWRKRAMTALTRVGLKKRMNHKPMELSGGERQRVAIARALVNDPALILADEPTGNLDSARGREIMQLLCALNQEGRTLIMVTHDASCAQYAKRVVVVADGQIVSER